MRDESDSDEDDDDEDIDEDELEIQKRFTSDAKRAKTVTAEQSVRFLAQTDSFFHAVELCPAQYWNRSF